jgi:hypothetical protein
MRPTKDADILRSRTIFTGGFFLHSVQTGGGGCRLYLLVKKLGIDPLREDE